MFANSWTIFFFKLYIVFDLHSVSSYFITFEFLCLSIFEKDQGNPGSTIGTWLKKLHVGAE